MVNMVFFNSAVVLTYNCIYKKLCLKILRTLHNHKYTNIHSRLTLLLYGDTLRNE